MLPGLRGSRASSGSGRVLEGLARQKPRGGNGGGQLGPWGPSQGWGLGRSNLLSEPWEGGACRSWSPWCCSVRALVYSRHQSVLIQRMLSRQTLLEAPWQWYHWLGRGGGALSSKLTAPRHPGAGAGVE